MTYTFWLCGCNYGRPGPYTKRLKCLMSTERLLVASEPPIEIHMEDIVGCRSGVTGGIASKIAYVEISIADVKKRIFLTPVDVYQPDSPFGDDGSESAAMRDVINSLRSEQMPRVDPNPYVRKYKSQSRSASLEPVDPNTSPWEYPAGLEPVGRISTTSAVTLAILILLAVTMIVIGLLNR